MGAKCTTMSLRQDLYIPPRPPMNGRLGAQSPPLHPLPPATRGRPEIAKCFKIALGQEAYCHTQPTAAQGSLPPTTRGRLGPFGTFRGHQHLMAAAQPASLIFGTCVAWPASMTTSSPPCPPLP